LNKTWEDRVSISPTPKGRSVGRGSWKSYDWPSKKVYRILEIHEVYEYAVTEYDVSTGEGGLFLEYIDTFLKLKSEASGYRSWVRTPADEDRYIEEFRQSEGIRLDKDSIRHNAYKRRHAKFCLNSM